MPVYSCRLLRSVSGEYDRRKRGTYRLRWRIKATERLFQRQMLEGAVAGVLPVSGGVEGNNWPLPKHGDKYDLEAVPAYDAEEEIYYVAGGFSGEKEDCVFADQFAVSFLDANHNIADVDVLFTPLQPGEDPLHRTQQNPLLRPAKWHWENETYTKVADRDIFGRPYTNACKKSFDRPPQLLLSRGVHVARFNVETQEDAIALSKKFDNSVNSVPWEFWSSGDPEPERSVICRYVRSLETMHECPLSYVPMEMGFVYANEKERVWDERSLNEGFGHYAEVPYQTYGYCLIETDFTTEDEDISVTELTIVKDSTGGATDPLPATIANPGIEGLNGNQLPLLWDTVAEAWTIGEPAVVATQYDPAEHSNGERVAEPILLRANGGRLPENMIGNFVTGRLRAEVDFNDLNDLLLPPQE